MTTNSVRSKSAHIRIKTAAKQPQLCSFNEINLLGPQDISVVCLKLQSLFSEHAGSSGWKPTSPSAFRHQELSSHLGLSSLCQKGLYLKYKWSTDCVFLVVFWTSIWTHHLTTSWHHLKGLVFPSTAWSLKGSQDPSSARGRHNASKDCP